MLIAAAVLMAACGLTGRKRRGAKHENCWPGLSCNECPNPCGEQNNEN